MCVCLCVYGGGSVSTRCDPQQMCSRDTLSYHLHHCRHHSHQQHMPLLVLLFLPSGSGGFSQVRAGSLIPPPTQQTPPRGRRFLTDIAPPLFITPTQVASQSGITGVTVRAVPAGTHRRAPCGLVDGWPRDRSLLPRRIHAPLSSLPGGVIDLTLRFRSA